MDPRSVAGEFLDEHGAGDGAAAFAAADVLNVSDAALDEFAIVVINGHLPHFFADGLGAGEKFVGEGLIGAEDADVDVGESDDDGTGQSRAHDDGEKTVLGMKIPAGGGIEDGEKVLDLVARHPSTAHFISKKLAMRFVADEPPQALVDRMAVTFTRTDGDLRAVMRTMLESKEFFSLAAYQSKLKSPLEVVASAARALNADVDFAFPLANQVAQLGEPLYRKQEPTGYSNNSKEWLNSAGLMARMNFALQLADNKVPGVKVDSAKAAKPEDPIAGIALGSPEFQKR